MKLRFKNKMFFITKKVYEELVDDYKEKLTLLHLFLFLFCLITLFIDLLILPFMLLASIEIRFDDVEYEEDDEDDDYHRINKYGNDEFY